MRVSVPAAPRLQAHQPRPDDPDHLRGRRARRNVMAAAWVMAVDYDPAKLVAVIAADTFTRTLIEQSGEFVVNVPTLKLIDVASRRRPSAPGEDDDKFAAYGLTTAGLDRRRAAHRGLRGVARCRVVPEPHMQERYDLFVGRRRRRLGRRRRRSWTDCGASSGPESRTLHHLSSGAFVTSGEIVTVKS